VAAVLHKLDNVSGDLNALHSLLSGERYVEWSKEEDDLLSKNSELLKKWKGNQSTDRRKKYLNFKTR